MTQSSFSSSTEYFFEEGKSNLRSCVRIAFDAAVQRGIQTIVMFTGVGEGPLIAIQDYLRKPDYEGVGVVAVTFPYGKQFGEGKHVEIPKATKTLLQDSGIPLIRAHLPLDPIGAQYKHHGVLGQDLSLMGNALSIFGGSMSLCVQAASMACDAGLFELGEHVISMTSDTAVIVRTAPTERLLTDFIVREILCKPLYLTIGKGEEPFPSELPDSTAEPTDTIEGTSVPELLPPE
jgi:hypothetical protein